MDVTITFRGLFLFAPRAPKGAEPEMRMILPSSPAEMNMTEHDHAASGAAPVDHRHVPQILYYAPSSAGPSVPTFVDFAGWDLILPAFAGALDRSVHDLADISQVLSPAKQKTLNESKATSVIRLNAGSLATDTRNCEWKWLGQTTPLALTVTWTGKVGAATFDIAVRPRHGGATLPLLSLTPTDDKLAFDIRHFPFADAGVVDRPQRPLPTLNTPAEHFSMFYDLFDVADPSAFSVPQFVKRTGMTTLAIEPITCVPGGCPDCCSDC